jgi:hypothetical protein
LRFIDFFTKEQTRVHMAFCSPNSMLLNHHEFEGGRGVVLDLCSVYVFMH